MKKDFLIIGQGLAGSFLAWNLLKRGKTLSIVDEDHKDCSSFAAAGMINPITGKRLVLSSRCEELLPYAKNVYLELEKQFGKKFFEEKQIIRLFRDDLELQEWEKKSGQTHLKKYYGKKQYAGAYGDAINDELGSFVIQQGGYCRKHELMECFTNLFKEKNILFNERFDQKDLEMFEDKIVWKGDEFLHIIFCEGYQAQDNEFFSYLPFNHAKGEILTLRNDENKLPDAVISCGKWCIPIKQGEFTVGSTYAWDNFDSSINDWAKQEILDEISKFLNVEFEVIDHRAAVRPIMKDLKPAIGIHPEYKNVSIFNGLASKGLLWSPFYSNQMAEFLVEGVPLEDEVNITRFN